MIDLNAAAPARSFVIPVLDYSPASEYSIVTLLEDLEQIPGDVIVVFNSPEVAGELKRHHRINHYAIINQNIGVARAWNIGLNIAETPTVFVINADLHITLEAINALENALWSLDQAACVGPQGAFTHFGHGTNYKYFDKGSFEQPIEVDSVSGFLFCVKREQFVNATLLFDNNYTPCYFEEWDLGFQIKKAGLKSYIIPTICYDHHWSNYIRSDRTITYFGREEKAQNILERNRKLFMDKWSCIVQKEGIEWLLESGWKSYAMAEANRLITEGDHPAASQLISNLIFDYPEDSEIMSLHRFISVFAAKLITSSSTVEFG